METIPLPPEISDEGEGVKQIEADIDYQLLLKRLPEITRKVIELKMAGHNIPDIAKECHISPYGAKSEMRRARKILKNRPL
jgi:DNA-directed RNA polymerase specialized sigma24 family protein